MHWGWFSKLKASLWVAWLLHVTLLGMRADDWEMAAFWKLSKTYFQRIVRTTDAETTTKQNAMLLSAQTLLKSFDPLVVQFVPQFDDVWWYQTLGHPGSVLDACIGWSNRAFMCVCVCFKSHFIRDIQIAAQQYGFRNLKNKGCSDCKFNRGTALGAIKPSTKYALCENLTRFH